MRQHLVYSLLKKLERFLKKSFQNIVFNSKSRNTPILLTSISNELVNSKRILLLRQDRIGDLLISVPLIKSLRKALPQSRLDLLLSYKNVAAKNCIVSAINNIYVFPKGFWGRVVTLLLLKKNNYDLIVDLYDNASFSSSFIIKFANPKFSLGFDKENRNIYTHIVSLPDKMKVHIVDRLRRFLVPFGYENYLANFEFSLTKKSSLPDKEKKRVGIVISGSSDAKFWGQQNFLELIILLQNKYNYDIVVFGTKKYRKILEFLGKNTYTYVAPITDDFDEFASMIASCDFLITPDTSVVHLASAFNIPVVVLYTFVNEKYGMPWFPYKTKYIALTSKKDKYEDINPEDILDAFQKLIK